MTKKQVVKKLNALIKKHTKELITEVNDVLTEADMWYSMGIPKIPKSIKTWDRGANFFVFDGIFDDDLDIKNFFHTRKEMIEVNPDRTFK